MAPLPPSSQEELMLGNRRCWSRRNERHDPAHPIVRRFGDRSFPRFLISVAVVLFFVSVVAQPVSGEWYAQICPTGSVEAVAIDTATNRLIFVNHNLGGGSSSHNNTNDDEYTPPSMVLVDDVDNKNVFNSSSPATESASGAATSIPSHHDDDKHQNRSFLRRSLQQISPFLLMSQTQLEEQYEQSPALKISLSKEQNNGRILQNQNDVIGDGGIDGDMDGTVSNFTVDNYRNGEIFFIRPCLCYNGRNRFSSSSSSSPSGTTTTASSSTADELHLCNADASYCGVPVDGTMPVACYSVKMQQVVARNAWPLILLWYFGLSVICLCTIHGHTAGECVKSCLLPHYNERFFDRMLNSNNNNPRNDDTRRHNWWSWQRHRFEQNLMLQVQWIWRHEEYNRERRRRQQGLPAPQLELKVKRWTNNHNNHHHSTDWTEVGDDSMSEDAAATPLVSSIELGSVVPTSGDAPSRGETSLNDNEPITTTEDSNGTTIDLKDTRNEGGSCSPDDDVPDEDHHDNDVNSYDEHSCTICFAPLEEGDRIGDLRCNHEFHVDCLKTWVQRKNACPLCNVPIGSRKDPQEESEVEQEQHSRDPNGQRRRRRPLLGGGNLSRLQLENRRIGIIGVSMVVENDRVDPERTSMDNDHTTGGR
ncbi:ring finger domain containing protein [Nitzschia inconspicua]|uniref:RING-type E3 ubiquitin transferase n=1 Tax=Nitzschia inconspicua TaxID=303405 RepID=A0A9K3PKT7_9STRA|nr:ring finger domain containing protein [Nitzschia inconspicua]